MRGLAYRRTDGSAQLKVPTTETRDSSMAATAFESRDWTNTGIVVGPSLSVRHV